MSAWAAMGLETGGFGVGLDVDAAKLADVLDGGNAKRERTARATRDAAYAERDAALAALELAKLQAAGGAAGSGGAMGAMTSGGAMTYQASAPAGGLGGLLGKLKEASPLGGLPWWMVLAGGVGVLWAVKS